MSKECGADHVINYSNTDVVAEVLELTNNEGVDAVVDATHAPSSFLQSASVVKRGGKWIVVDFQWRPQHEDVLGVCERRGVKPHFGDFARYWAVPHYISLAQQHITHMLRSCDKLYAEGVHVRVTKTIPFELEKVSEEVTAVGESRRSGKVVIRVAGDN